MDSGDTTCKKCDYCSFSFVGHAKYYNHARKDHADIVAQTWEACSKCGKRFPDKKALDKHCDRKHRHEKHVCHVCCKEYVSKYRYILHANEKHKDMVKESWEQCKTCLVCYPDMKTLENHQQSAHLEDTYNYFHSENASEVCQFCMAPCNSKASFYQHVSTYHQDHVANIWKKCDTCNLMFPDVATLTMHKQSTHKKKGKSFNNLKNSKKICKFCNFQYDNLEQFYNHCNAEHSQSIDKSWLQCNKCSKYYPDRRILYQHFKIHREKNGGNSNSSSNSTGNNNSSSNSNNNRQPQQNGVNNSWSEFGNISQQPAQPQPPTQPYSQQCQPASNGQPPLQPQILTPLVSAASLASTPSTQIWSHVAPSVALNSDSNTCFICNESFSVTQAYYHHANFKHRDVLAKSWHLCQVCMWYYPTEAALRSHGCCLPISNGHSNDNANNVTTAAPQKETPPPPTVVSSFGQPATTAFTVYHPSVAHVAAPPTYGILGLPPQVTMQEFFLSPSHSTQVARDFLSNPGGGSGKSDFAELKNVTLNGWLEGPGEANRAQPAAIPQLIHHYPGYL